MRHDLVESARRPDGAHLLGVRARVKLMVRVGVRGRGRVRVRVRVS